MLNPSNAKRLSRPTRRCEPAERLFQRQGPRCPSQAARLPGRGQRYRRPVWSPALCSLTLRPDARKDLRTSRATSSCSAPCGTPETVGPCTRRVTAEASAQVAFPVPTLSTSAFAAHGGTPRRQAIATTGPQIPPCSSETLKV